MLFLILANKELTRYMKPTWTGLPDLDTGPIVWRDLEDEQEQNLISQIGLTLWAALGERIRWGKKQELQQESE